VHAELVEYERDLTVVPDVCADIRSWVASGYQTLAPGTESSRVVLISGDEGSGPSLESLIARHEDRVQRRLARSLKRVEGKLQEQIGHVLTTGGELLAKLGVKTPPISGGRSSAGHR
jgi:hypothetical protein